jgi:hypothetical protein
MKTSYAVGFFILLLLVVGGIFLFLNKQGLNQPQILLQTLDCSSDKIDRSILDLDGRTILIGAMISFKKVPLDDNLKNKLTAWQIKLDEKSWIFDYVIAKIPTQNLCSLVQEEQVSNVFIPQVE